MDNENRKIYSLAELQKYTYRILQQIAKSMSLPSNVKKMYLIEMIHAKKFKSKDDLEDIIQKVKQERQQMSQAKKKGARKRSYLQGPEISSTSNSLSPPISMTPKRPAGHIVIRCSPENIRQAIAKYNAKHNYLTRNSTGVRKTYQSPKRSDRILRSCNMKTTKNDNDVKMIDAIDTSPKNSFRGHITNNMSSNVNNSVFNVLRSQNVNRETQKPRILKMPEHCVVKKYVPVVSGNTFGRDPERSQLVPVKRNVNTFPMAPAKRQRVLSGVYPIVPKEPPKVSYEYVHSVGFRRQDGKIAKINALVQKRMDSAQDIEVTVQDIINCSLSQTFTNPEYVNSETNTNLTYTTINPEEQRNVYDQNIDLKNIIHTNIDQINYRDGNTNADQLKDRGGNVNIDQLNDRSDIVNVDYRSNGYDDSAMVRNCEENPYSVYYHKKIRGEQVRSQKSFQREVPRDMEDRLPKINAVFSRFNAHTDVTKPIYVQVSQESERFQQYPIFMARTTNTNLLESLYNFRSPFLVNQPLQQIATTTNTRCVYSTPIIATAVAQQSAALAPGNTATSYSELHPQLQGCEARGPLIHNILAFARGFARVSHIPWEHYFFRDEAYERDNLYHSDLSAFPKICELLQYGERQGHLRRGFRCDEEPSTSCSSLDDTTSQDLGATVTIPEMVEDALELISQDGDYMERIGMDVRVQCVMCSDVCPKFLLEYHLRKEHASDILPLSSNAWSLPLALPALAARRSRVLQHEAALYVLSAACRARCLHAALHTLTTDTNLPKSGSLTIYNKLTGEPYSWQGEIQPLPNDLPHDIYTEGLKVPISKLALLPDSANLILLNGELVLESPSEVFNQPDLNDIHVTLFVKIFN